MKFLQITLVFFLFVTCCIGQNYKPVQPGVIPYFYNKHSGYVRAMRIDSVEVLGSDTVYYPFHTPRNISYLQLDSNGGCWLGKTIIGKQDGTFLFDNLWGNDTAVIRTQASSGETWVFHHVPGETRYMATVVSQDTMTFGGLTDSIKTIRLSAYDSTHNLLPADSLHGLELIISKDHGFVQAFDIYTFPYHPHGQQNTSDYFMELAVDGAYGKHYSTFIKANYSFGSVAAQYNRQVGDVYQYALGDEWYPPESTPYYLDSIVSTTPLLISGWSSWPQQWSGPIINYYDSQPMTQPWDVAFSYPGMLPEENGQQYFYYYFPDDTSYCSQTPLYEFETNYVRYPTGEQPFLHFFEAAHDFHWYKTGLGQVKYVSYTFEGWLSDRRLVYYKKDGESCGSLVTTQSLPLHLTSITAVNEGSKNRITWHSEQDDAGGKYELERSPNASQFTPIATIGAKGRFSADYVFLDESPLPGRNYYRIKTIDAGGAVNYSKVATASVAGVKKTVIEIYPNPAKDILTISGSQLQSITIANLQGQVQLQVSASGDLSKINIADLSAGLFFVTVRTAYGEKITGRIIKE